MQEHIQDTANDIDKKLLKKKKTEERKACINIFFLKRS